MNYFIHLSNKKTVVSTLGHFTLLKKELFLLIISTKCNLDRKSYYATLKQFKLAKEI